MARDLDRRWKRFGEGLTLFVLLFVVAYATRFIAVSFPQYYGLHAVLAAPFFAAIVVAFLIVTEDLPLCLVAATIYAVALGFMSPIMLFTALVPAIAVLIAAGILMARYDRDTGRADENISIGLDRSNAEKKAFRKGGNAAANGTGKKSAGKPARGADEESNAGISPIVCGVVYASLGYPTAVIAGIVLSSSGYTWEYVTGGTVTFFIMLAIGIGLSFAGAYIAEVVVSRIQAGKATKAAAVPRGDSDDDPEKAYLRKKAAKSAAANGKRQ